MRRVMAARETVLRLVPSPWDRAEFLSALGRWRGRPIKLAAIGFETGDGSLCGLWLECADSDVIAYYPGTTEFHIDHIVAHETGHMVLGHGGGAGDSSGIRRLLPNIDPALIRRVLGRGEFADDQEAEAELFADLLLTGISRWRSSWPMRSFWGDQG